MAPDRSLPCVLSILWRQMLFALFSVLIPSAGAASWGSVGHQVIAEIAQNFLGERALQEAIYFLPTENGRLADVANWADQVRNSLPWSSPFHYVDLPDWLCTYDYSRDCFQDQCVCGAIQNYTGRLANVALPDAQRTEALKFLVHFVSDLHQPLHAGFLGDLGGNDLNVYFFGSSTNLHTLWDTGLLMRKINTEFGGSQTSYVANMLNRLASEWSPRVPEWLACNNSQPYHACADDWADESGLLSCVYAYMNVDGTPLYNGVQLSDQYYELNIPVVEERIAQGGVRLAQIFNSVFPSFKAGAVRKE